MPKMATPAWAAVPVAVAGTVVATAATEKVETAAKEKVERRRSTDAAVGAPTRTCWLDRDCPTAMAASPKPAKVVPRGEMLPVW